MTITFNRKLFRFTNFFKKYTLQWMIVLLVALSAGSFTVYYFNHFGLAYNDARSHLDIGRRVVENLKPGIAQLGSVWLPLPHLLMIPTIWNDFMWHSGLAGALQSMVSYVLTSLVIYTLLKNLGVGWLGRLTGTAVFALNLNILYLQSTAMTELLLLATMTLGVYELVMWHREDQLVRLIKAAFWIMLSTLIRYDGWFLLMVSSVLIAVQTFRKKGWTTMQGTLILFGTLAGFGIALWFLWNQLIFKDPLYFVSGPYSAYSQQLQLEKAGNLATKHNLPLSVEIYWLALLYNSYTLPVLLAAAGIIVFLTDKKQTSSVRIGSLVLLSPFVFNIIALYFGQSVLFIQGLSGNTWFNVRYGVMMMPSLAFFIGYLTDRAKQLRYVFLGLLCLVIFFSFTNSDIVTLDDARFGSSGKNVAEISSWLKQNAADKPGFVLISAASHDAIIFSSGMPMSRFIHEGTGIYWDNAISRPDKWARWIIMRSNDLNDLTFRSVKSSGYLYRYRLVEKMPFADIYELQEQYLKNLNTKPILPRQL